MLKIAVAVEEKHGGILMQWWDGNGAARVFATKGAALLLERAEGRSALSDMARDGRDATATSVICETIARLHAPRGKPYPDLIPLSEWFAALAPKAASEGGILATCAALAKNLLADQHEVVGLHGDVHHANILDFGDDRWLAIDPKGILGDRAFDYANLFCNPDRALATNGDLFKRRVEMVSHLAGLERRRLLRWLIAWAGLSASWHIEDGESPALALDVAAIALAALEA
jgi:streptomycin 6-kinase